MRHAFTCAIALGLLTVTTPSFAKDVRVCLGGNVATYYGSGTYTYSDGTVGRWRGSPTPGGSVTIIGRQTERVYRKDRFVVRGGQMFLVNQQGQEYSARYC